MSSLWTAVRAPLWEDLRAPASGINPPGAASDPTRNNTNGLLTFSGTQDNIISVAVQTATLVTTDDGALDRHHLSDFPAITMTGKTVSCMGIFLIQRSGSTDAYNSTVDLLEFDIHYQATTLGSDGEHTKSM